MFTDSVLSETLLFIYLRKFLGLYHKLFRDIFPFSFVLLISGLLDIVSRFSLDVPFAQVFQQLLTPIFKGAESYPAMMLIWFMCALLWFVGIHGPSIVLPAVTALQLSNMEENAQLLANGQFPLSFFNT